MSVQIINNSATAKCNGSLGAVFSLFSLEIRYPDVLNGLAIQSQLMDSCHKPDIPVAKSVRANRFNDCPLPYKVT